MSSTDSSPNENLAYATVMTVMDNLHRKGWLARELDGRAYRYQAVHPLGAALLAALAAVWIGTAVTTWVIGPPRRTVLTTAEEA